MARIKILLLTAFFAVVAHAVPVEQDNPEKPPVIPPGVPPGVPPSLLPYIPPICLPYIPKPILPPHYQQVSIPYNAGVKPPH
ncbi:non-classical arabinogalactan protein 31-like [Cryptotermes secundus]|uniref:non-classical arabinogalactan protein 31-like n=1 Tax=Cryptotermes secundus TaxID=105785 RepID=UPI000CD7D4FF|nr:non-classical arabinogalactan protein 31-like [Cryptotermes secundus]